MFRRETGEQTDAILHPGAAGRSVALRGSLGYLSMNKACFSVSLDARERLGKDRVDFFISFHRCKMLILLFF